MNETFERGLAVRKSALGDAVVERSWGEADDFDRPLQELLTEYCWGAVWARPGLERKQRSLITVALLAVLNRPIELQAHVKAAITHGCTRGEIRETLLHCTVYGGAPVGVTSFRLAKEALASLDDVQS